LRLLLLHDGCAPPRDLLPGLVKAGFAVDVARDAATGDRRARAAGHAGVVLDALLPGGDPLRLLEGWRSVGLPVPVLALASGGRAAERARCLDAGADDCLSRPFRLAELLARLRALLRRSHGMSGPVVRAFDLEIDAAARQVRRAGREIRLTPREYALLEFLALHRGRVVSRARIRESLSDEQDGGASNVVDVHVRYLRNKIDKGFDPPLILTRRGYGYLLRGEAGPAGGRAAPRAAGCGR
jgi:DNA-binding response OmpR family regulator